jgi:hypothetical protein
LEEGVPRTATLHSGAKQGKNDFGNLGYGGPAPPKGKAHRYFFKLYALGVALDLTLGATKAQLEDAMKGHSWLRDNSWEPTSGRQQPSLCGLFFTDSMASFASKPMNALFEAN